MSLTIETEADTNYANFLFCLRSNAAIANESVRCLLTSSDLCLTMREWLDLSHM